MYGELQTKLFFLVRLLNSDQGDCLMCWRVTSLINWDNLYSSYIDFCDLVGWLGGYFSMSPFKSPKKCYSLFSLSTALITYSKLSEHFQEESGGL